MNKKTKRLATLEFLLLQKRRQFFLNRNIFYNGERTWTVACQMILLQVKRSEKQYLEIIGILKWPIHFTWMIFYQSVLHSGLCNNIKITRGVDTVTSKCKSVHVFISTGPISRFYYSNQAKHLHALHATLWIPHNIA